MGALPCSFLGSTWWFIPLSKWVITSVINGISRVNPLITGVITHLLSGMNHQVWDAPNNKLLPVVLEVTEATAPAMPGKPALLRKWSGSITGPCRSAAGCGDGWIPRWLKIRVGKFWEHGPRNASNLWDSGIWKHFEGLIISVLGDSWRTNHLERCNKECWTPLAVGNRSLRSCRILVRFGAAEVSGSDFYGIQPIKLREWTNQIEGILTILKHQMSQHAINTSRKLIVCRIKFGCMYTMYRWDT